jgi:hypothetical protein
MGCDAMQCSEVDFYVGLFDTFSLPNLALTFKKKDKGKVCQYKYVNT